MHLHSPPPCPVLREFQDDPITITAYVGGAVILPCTVPYSEPKSVLSWKKKGRSVLRLPKGKLLTSGGFYLEQLTLGVSGIYRCRADNEVTEERVGSSFITLEVEGQSVRLNLLFQAAHRVCVCVCVRVYNLYFCRRTNLCVQLICCNVKVLRTHIHTHTCAHIRTHTYMHTRTHLYSLCVKEVKIQLIMSPANQTLLPN